MRTRPLYVRVSSADQKAEMQVRELRAYAEHQSWDIAEVYEDVMSGDLPPRISASDNLESPPDGKGLFR